jgi:hypothetical protein
MVHLDNLEQLDGQDLQASLEVLDQLDLPERPELPAKPELEACLGQLDQAVCRVLPAKQEQRKQRDFQVIPELLAELDRLVPQDSLDCKVLLAPLVLLDSLDLQA